MHLKLYHIVLAQLSDLVRLHVIELLLLVELLPFEASREWSVKNRKARVDSDCVDHSVISTSRIHRHFSQDLITVCASHLKHDHLVFLEGACYQHQAKGLN